MKTVSKRPQARWFALCASLAMVMGTVHAAEAGANADEWAAPGGDYAMTRHSTLSDINKNNAANLQFAWSMSTTAGRGHEGQPLVIGNMMYYVTPYPNYVWAVDLSEPDNYTVVWKYSPKQDEHAVAVACCDTVNRGLSYADGKLVFNTLDGQVVALDAKTGKEVWKVKRVDPQKGETSTPAPLIVRDIVISGMGGDEFGVRGRMQAYSLKDGHELWTCQSTGATRTCASAKASTRRTRSTASSATSASAGYPGDEWKRGGGAPWGWITYDPKLDLIYYGTGNPGTVESDLPLQAQDHTRNATTAARTTSGR